MAVAPRRCHLTGRLPRRREKMVAMLLPKTFDRTLVAAVACVLLATACSGSDNPNVPTPSSTRHWPT